MQLTTITITRKFNLGNYENVDITLSAALADFDDPVRASIILVDTINEIHAKRFAPTDEYDGDLFLPPDEAIPQ